MHAEHSMNDEEMCHPSDGEAWKHFHKVYPDFASESKKYLPWVMHRCF